MCLASTCFPLAYRFASFQKFRTRLSLPNQCLLKRTFASLKKVNKAGNSKFLKIFDFENLDFSGGARLSPFSWVDRFWIIILSKVHLWGPQNSAKINFVAHWIFIQGRWILDKLIYLKEGQILGLDFPKFVQIFASVWGFIFRVCFIRKVHWETILKSTYRYSTLEFSEHLIKT